MRHIVDYKAPIVLHPILLKEYYPYLDDDASGHFQVGRGYDKRGSRPLTIGYFEPWNQQRFDPSEPYIDRVQWRQRLQELPRQPGPLPAQHRRLMRGATRYVVPAARSSSSSGARTPSGSRPRDDTEQQPHDDRGHAGRRER